MCGIAGVYYSDQCPVSVQLIERMTGALRHRGPDGEGFHLEPGVGLGHRRLSIIDLSAGQQPMANEDGTIWVTFNGEIYNYLDLRKRLEEQGHCLRTASDTETIVHAYEQHGDSCVQHLHGMFAFALWDGGNQRLYLARDRVGIKPLYYYYDEQQFVFASELKALLLHPGVGRDLDLTALEDYLVYGYIPLDKTIFRRVRKLLPGHYAVVDRSSSGLRLQTHHYWDLQFRPDRKPSAADWVAGLRNLLEVTVKSHMISDVPIGAFLSGGLDSSCVVAFMAQASSKPIKTFTIGFEEPDFDELPHARRVAEQYGTEHHELLVQPDAIELLPLLAQQFDEPFGDSSAIPTYYVSQLARSHVTVVLSGDGGDEAFAGYKRYAHTAATLKLQQRLDFLPVSLRRVLFGMMARSLPPHTPGKGTLRRLGMSACETYLDVAYFHESAFLKELLHSEIRTSLRSNGNTRSFEAYYAAAREADPLSRMQYLDTKTYLPEDILTKVDRASMLTSLESRVPLLDHQVLEFAARIPSDLKFRDGEGKYIFKRLLRDLLPQSLLSRPKMGFGVPLVHWFKKDLLGYTRDVLFSPRSLERGFFRRESVEGVLEEHRRGRADRSHDIWRLLFFEHWCRHYLDATVSSR